VNKPVWVEVRAEKSVKGKVVRIKVAGGTYDYKDQLKGLGFRWDPHLREWHKYEKDIDSTLDLLEKLLKEIPASSVAFKPADFEDMVFVEVYSEELGRTIPAPIAIIDWQATGIFITNWAIPRSIYIPYA